MASTSIKLDIKKMKENNVNISHFVPPQFEHTEYLIIQSYLIKPYGITISENGVNHRELGDISQYIIN